MDATLPIRCPFSGPKLCQLRRRYAAAANFVSSRQLPFFVRLADPLAGIKLYGFALDK